MVYLKWKQNNPKKTGTSEGEIFIASLTLLEWRKFTISSGLHCFLRACALILCLCFIHFCIPSAHPTSGHMSMNFNLGLCEYQVICPRSWSWSAKNGIKRKKEKWTVSTSVFSHSNMILRTLMLLCVPIQSHSTKPHCLWYCYRELQNIQKKKLE